MIKAYGGLDCFRDLRTRCMRVVIFAPPLLCPADSVTAVETCCWADTDKMVAVFDWMYFASCYFFIYEGWNFNSDNYLFTTDTK